jgi:hypothetical protein
MQVVRCRVAVVTARESGIDPLPPLSQLERYASHFKFADTQFAFQNNLQTINIQTPL